LSLYMTLNFGISSLIFGTLNPLNTKLNPICHLLALLGAHHIPHVSRIRVKSARTTWLDIYHGAFTVARRTLFLYLCNISMFELLAVPQRGKRTMSIIYLSCRSLSKYHSRVSIGVVSLRIQKSIIDTNI
jgi:hypothetical protein